MSDTLEIFGIEYTGVTGIVATDDNGNDLTYTRGGGSPSLQNKTVTPSTSQQSVTADSGYDGLGTVTVNAMPTGTATAPASINGTNADYSVEYNSITLTKNVSVTPNIETAGYISTGTPGTALVSLQALITTRAAATYTPGTSNQKIPSGTYCIGAQTISGDENLVASNIISGKSIFGVAGSVSFVTYYTGSSTPASSLGSNGDIYLKTV